MLQKHYQLIGIGSALVDTEIKLKDTELQQFNIEKGLMTLVDNATQQQILSTLNRSSSASLYQSSGGSAGNTIYAAGLFGIHSGFVCKVADDANGRLYQLDMQNAGIDTSAQQFSEQDLATGQCLVMVTPDAQRTMCTDLGASASIDIGNVPNNWSADIAYIESYLATSNNGRTVVKAFCQQIRQSGGKIALSLSDPGIVESLKQPIMDMVNNRVDIVFCNRDEARQWTAAKTVQDMLNALNQFANLIIITDGGNGAYINDGNTTIHVAGQDVAVLDTNGAGDMFAGAFLSAYINDNGIEHSGKFACQMAGEIIGVFAPRLDRQRYLTMSEMI